MEIHIKTFGSNFDLPAYFSVWCCFITVSAEGIISTNRTVRKWEVWFVIHNFEVIVRWVLPTNCWQHFGIFYNCFAVYFGAFIRFRTRKLFLFKIWHKVYCETPYFLAIFRCDCHHFTKCSFGSESGMRIQLFPSLWNETPIVFWFDYFWDSISWINWSPLSLRAWPENM